MMGRSASTISRELRRNALPRGEYKPGSADRIACLVAVSGDSGACHKRRANP